MRFLQKCWPWLGYSSISITAFFLKKVTYQLNCLISSEQLLVLIEYVPFGDLLGYLRKSRGLNDTYYKDPDIKPQTNLTSQQLIKFAWQIADGMSYLSSKFVSWTKEETRKQSAVKNLITIYPFKAYLLGRIIFWYNVNSLNDYAWEVRTFSQRLQGNSSIFDVIIYFCSFFSVGFGNRCASM